jgi:hypothetical protein
MGTKDISNENNQSLNLNVYSRIMGNLKSVKYFVSQ